MGILTFMPPSFNEDWWSTEPQLRDWTHEPAATGESFSADPNENF